MDRTSIYSILGGLRQCLAEFRDLDYIIRVYRQNFQPDLRHAVDYSILMHECIHYLQFLYTSFGRDVAFLRRMMLLSAIDILRNLPQPVYVPVLSWLEKEPEVRNSPWVSAFSMCLSILEEQWKKWISLNAASWDSKLQSLYSRISHIKPEYLMSQAPLELDLTKPAFILTTPDGIQEVFEIGALQVIEFMARIVEVHHACVRGYWPEISSHINIWGTQNLDYNAPLLYLIQNGVLGQPGDPMAWVETPVDLLYLPLLVVISHIALMDSWFCVRRWEYKKFQGVQGEVPVPYALKTLPGFTGKPANTFSRLLRLIGCPEPWEYQELLQLAMDGFKTENWVEVADRLCIMAGVARYSEMCTLALEALREEWRMVSSSMRGLGRMSSILEGEYQAAIQASEFLLHRQDVTGYPLRLLDSLPRPIVSGPLQDGSGLGFIELWGERPTYDLQAAILLCAWNHLVEKLLYGQDLACFWEDSPVDTLWSCPERMHCFKRLKQSRTASRVQTQSTRGSVTLLRYCTNPEWARIVTQMLSELGISDVQALGNS